MTPRKALVLDFGGVLTTPLIPAALAFERREGLAEGTLFRALYADAEMIRLTEELERGTLTQSRWNAEAADRTGLAADNLMGRLFADLRPQPELIGAAAAARRAGVPVALLTNSVGRAPWDLYAGYDLDFDAVVISEDHGVRKPEEAAFALVLDKLGLAAADCVFVDDTASYLPPAAALGFATVHAEEPGRTVAALERLLGLPLAPR
ncbi:HAD-IA family hydrolase [Streptomyces sp. SID11385]|uniref:HAD-IA family hydrolase n=1 Tax=Streptomyces sp. SID11385 TaxID=2706031 RepID=UPI0013CC8967|nr:HAD-IA family hydrolase [Streptomyces sp. SID11385]NEA41426.1 HAD-IA family hydrolase [Streptomyces sp. SID11385]